MVVLLSTDREVKMAKTVARIIRLRFMAAPFRFSVGWLNAHTKGELKVDHSS